MIRITAQRRSRKMVALLMVEVDSDSYRPRLQTIRFETPERTIEFRLTATAIQPILRSELSAAVFRPDAGVAREVRAEPALPRPEASVHPPVTEPPVRLPAIDPRAVEAQFVLHQAGACLGESVRIAEEPPGVRVDRIGNEPDSYRSPLDLGYMLAVLSDLRRGQPARGDNQPRTVALRHAWAMRRLAENFPAGAIADLPPASWHMLESMLRDHISGMRSERDGLELQPLSSSRAGPAEPGWRASATILHEALTQPNPEFSVQDFELRLNNILRDFSIESRGRGTHAR